MLKMLGGGLGYDSWLVNTHVSPSMDRILYQGEVCCCHPAIRASEMHVQAIEGCVEGMPIRGVRWKEKPTTELPEKMSDLLKLALMDLEYIENTPGYEVDMEGWVYTDNDTCFTCLAGAVMVKTLHRDWSHGLCPIDFLTYDCAKLIALNSLRQGKISEASEFLGRPMETRFEFVPLYEKDPNAFKAAINNLIDVLETMGV